MSQFIPSYSSDPLLFTQYTYPSHSMREIFSLKLNAEANRLTVGGEIDKMIPHPRILFLFIFAMTSTTRGQRQEDTFLISVPLEEIKTNDDAIGGTFHSRKFLRKHSLTLKSHANVPHGPQKALWFNQILDHFDPTAEEKIWKQRFWVNKNFYRPNGPIFIMIGGEGKANPIWMEQGTWIEYAKEFGALCFQLEHRFYGESHPTEDMSVDNLKYLSSEQALADLAYFITEMNTKYNLSEPKWIAFGGSYPGSLAAWLRLKYPHLVHGSVSTSGPLHAKADFMEYLEVVSDAFDQTDKKCKPAIQNGMKNLQMFTLHRVGWQMITKDFKLCTPFQATNSADVSNFFETVIGNFEDVVQYNKDNRKFEGAKNTNVTVETLCNIMTRDTTNFEDMNFQAMLGDVVFELYNEIKSAESRKEFHDIWKKVPGLLYKNRNNGKSSYQRLAEVNALTLDMNEEKCLDYNYDSMIKELRNESWSSSAGVGGRQWQYQTCTEFGWYQSSDQPGHPYTDLFPVQFLEKQCQDIFGPKYNLDMLEKGIKRTNILYGSTNIKVTNVAFVHGTFDPWHALGVTKDIGSNTAILIPGTAHCANMYPASPDDPKELTEARETIKQKIAEWLS